MAISRRLPNTNPGRATALRKAKEKNDSLNQPDRFLTNQTQERLNNIQPDYKKKSDAIDEAKAKYSGVIAKKGDTRNDLETFVRAFLSQVIQGVKMGKLKKDDKAYYNLNVDNDLYPDLVNDDDLRNVAEKIVSGESSRVGNGGETLPWPKAGEVESRLAAFVSASLDASNKKDALDKSEEDLEKLNTEANGVIRKVWDEVETFYNEETIESKRNNARQWGVVYINTDSKPSVVTMHVVDSATEQPLANATATDKETGASANANASGDIKLEVGHEGATEIEVSAPDHTTQTKEADLVAGETTDIGDVKLPPK